MMIICKDPNQSVQSWKKKKKPTTTVRIHHCQERLLLSVSFIKNRTWELFSFCSCHDEANFHTTAVLIVLRLRKCDNVNCIVVEIIVKAAILREAFHRLLYLQRTNLHDEKHTLINILALMWQSFLSYAVQKVFCFNFTRLRKYTSFLA